MPLQSCSTSFTYDVFLSFRGSDTRLGFTGHLYKALDDKGIHTFIDDEELQRGEEITPSLVKAIQESRIAIIVLSKDYASSSFCLDELATIIDCKSKGMLVIPVFYKVDPSDVRHHLGGYGEALAKHEKRFKYNMDKLQKWKMALHQVANLSGYHLEDRVEYEYKFIGTIVASVSQNINHPTRLHVGDCLVGLESRLSEVMELLDVESDDGVHIIGIHGMGGVGKSTLAQTVYSNLIFKNFDGSCFLENVREKSNNHGLEHLQKALLQEILREKEITITSVKEGASMIQHRLRRKKVLLVLDDVDKPKQFEAIVGRPDWFGRGSIVIITTRDKQLLASCEVKRTYKVKKLSENDAFQLLTWRAFKTQQVDPKYVNVLNHVLSYASGLPLALEVIGSDLFGKSVEEWESAIKQYKRTPKKEILEILKVSIDALEEEEKSVFLDISCCLKGYQLTEVEVILSALYGDSMKHHIGVLVAKSLVKVSLCGTVKLHDLIQLLGRQIDQKESPKEPGKRRRLWFPKDIIEVLEDNTGTREIEIIYLDVPVSEKAETIEWDGNAFKKMKNLKILIIKNGKFSEGLKFLPNSLRVLEWWRYPSHLLPSDFQQQNLVICKLPGSCFTSIELKKFVNLGVLNFDKCKFLTEIADVSDLLNLKELSFQECVNLFTVHKSVGFLGKLEILNASGCCKLESFPPIRLTSLQDLNLSDCSSLLIFPEILEKMENIRQIFLYGSPIKELPLSFLYLIGLQHLCLHDCEIFQLPSRILIMPERKRIEVSYCNGWRWVKQENDEEKLGSFVYSKVFWLHVSSCNLNDDFFSIGFMRFVNLSNLDLSENNFTFLPGDGWRWVKQENDEEKLGSIVYSKVFWLHVPSCNLNDDFFSIGFMRFVNLSNLDLSENNFTFLPGCIKEFQYLRDLNVNDCKRLQEIRGVPPNLQTFEARNCRSLTSSSLSMLINQESLSAQTYVFSLPGTCIPEWFDHQSRGPTSYFWFRNKFPDNVLCLLIVPVEYNTGFYCLHPVVFINGKVHEPSGHKYKNLVRMEMDHTYIFSLCSTWRYDQFEVPLENEWNHVEVTYEGMIETSIIKATGIHVFKQESNNEDIRFTDPYNKRKLDYDLNSFESQNKGLLKKV